VHADRPNLIRCRQLRRPTTEWTAAYHDKLDSDISPPGNGSFRSGLIAGVFPRFEIIELCRPFAAKFYTVIGIQKLVCSIL